MSNQKILLIDYDPASISKTATPLTKAGYSVEVAKDGLSGLAAFERIKPALVLVEAMLPRKHGFEVCQEIKARPDGKSTPVLITSAVCRGRKYRMDALQIYGCDEYIEKPIPDGDLVSMIGRLIEEAAKATDEVKQDLSDAIEKAAPRNAPEAIESMSDDELEAKIDALLMGPSDAMPADAPPAASVETSATPPEEPMTVAAAQAPKPEPVVEVVPTATPEPQVAEMAAAAVAVSDSEAPLETVSVGEPSPIDDAAEEAEPADEGPLDAESEMERRVAAMVEIDKAKIDTPVIDPLPAVEPAAEAPAMGQPEADEQATDDVFNPVDTAEETAAEIATPEWTETSKPAKSGSKAILFGVAAAVLLGLAGFLAFQQGWIGGGAETSAASDNASFETPNVEPTAAAETSSATTANDAMTGTDTRTASQDAVPAETTPPASRTEPPPVVPPKPQPFQGRSKAELDAAAQRQREAEQAMNAAAGSLQSALLSKAVGEPSVVEAGPAVPVELDDDLIGTPEPPKPTRGQLFDITEVDTLPLHKEFAQPVYDVLARRLRQEGEVIVSVLIDDSGYVTNVELIQPIPKSRLNNVTVEAAMEWVYQPATKDGVPVSVWKTERIVFRLN